MRKKGISILLATLIMGSFSLNSSAGGIPVIDVASIARLVLQYQKQVEQYQAQLQQLEAIRGSRGMGAVANDPNVRLSLPPDFYEAYSKIQSQGRNGASAGAKAIYDAVKKFGCNEQFKAGSQDLIQCEAKAMHAVTNVENSTKALKSSQARVNQLQELMSKIDTANDAKAAADLHNRILAEQTFLQNEMMMMQLAREQKAAQGQLQAVSSAEEGQKKLFGSPNTNPFK